MNWLIETVEIPRYVELCGLLCAFYTLYYILKDLSIWRKKDDCLSLDDIEIGYRSGENPSIKLHIKKES